MEIVIYLALSASAAWVINQVPNRFLRWVLWIPCMPLLPGLLIVTAGALVLGGLLRFLDGLASQTEPRNQSRQAPPPPRAERTSSEAPTLNDYWRAENAKMTQAELIAGIAEGNVAIERFKKQLETETVRFEKLWTAIQLTNAEMQQRLMYEEMIRRRKQRRTRVA
jgi:hypothetical protein